jgi:hypothetical protein
LEVKRKVKKLFLFGYLIILIGLISCPANNVATNPSALPSETVSSNIASTPIPKKINYDEEFFFQKENEIIRANLNGEIKNRIPVEKECSYFNIFDKKTIWTECKNNEESFIKLINFSDNSVKNISLTKKLSKNSLYLIIPFPKYNQFIYITNNEKDSNTFVKVDLNGKETERATIENSNFSISEDGKKIAYIYDDNVFIINSDGTNKLRVAELEISIDKLKSPDISFDGKYILYKENSKIFIVSSNGKNKINFGNAFVIGSSTPDITEYKWMPDRNELIFKKIDENNKLNLFSFNPETSKTELIANNIKSFEILSDKNKILFKRFNEIPFVDTVYNYNFIDYDKKNIKYVQLSNNYAKFTPNLKKVAYTFNEKLTDAYCSECTAPPKYLKSEVNVIDIDKSEAKIIENTQDGRYFSIYGWSSDNNILMYSIVKDNFSNILFYDTENNLPVKLNEFFYSGQNYTWID